MAKKSLKDRLKRRRQEIKERSSGSGNIFFIKAGKTRFRILPVEDEDEDFSFEATHFYLGNVIKGVFSRASLGEDCPIQEYYEELKESGNAEDKEKAKKFPPRKKYLVPVVIYKDERGREIDTERGVCLMMLPSRTYGEVIDAYLDPDLGDFTDPVEGYDFKVTRTGTGKTDTEYTIQPMRPSALPKEFSKPVNLHKMIDAALPSKEKVQEYLEQWKETMEDGDEPEEKPRKKKGKKVRKHKGDA